jgi:hypothetical protein
LSQSREKSPPIKSRNKEMEEDQSTCSSDQYNSKRAHGETRFGCCYSLEGKTKQENMWNDGEPIGFLQA